MATLRVVKIIFPARQVARAELTPGAKVVVFALHLNVSALFSGYVSVCMCVYV